MLGPQGSLGSPQILICGESGGNGRMGRYWQTLLLSRWKGIFAWLPVETIVKKYQQEYYKAIAQSDAKGDSTDFIVFMLKCILQTISEQQKVTDDVGINVGINLGLLSVEHNKV